MVQELARALIYPLSLVMLSVSLSAQTDSASGQQIFASTCAACHGLDGRGGEHAPNIATEPKIQSVSDPVLLKIIRNGIPAAGMPGFASSLDPAQIAAVLSYLRSLQGRGRNEIIVGDGHRGREL